MAVYKIFFKRSVEKDFKNIPKKDLARILDRIGGSLKTLAPWAVKD